MKTRPHGHDAYLESLRAAMHGDSCKKWTTLVTRSEWAPRLVAVPGFLHLTRKTQRRNCWLWTEHIGFGSTQNGKLERSDAVGFTCLAPIMCSTKTGHRKRRGINSQTETQVNVLLKNMFKGNYRQSSTAERKYTYIHPSDTKPPKSSRKHTQK